jgi:Quinohemoprotein amine dehydrogenase A, alpha subunit, haem binding
MRSGTTLLVILLTMATVAQAADGPIVLPPGPAKATVEAKCKRCHDLKKVVKQRQDPKWWAATLEKMVDKGLEIEPEDEVEVVKYLSKNFGLGSGGKGAAH